MMGIIEFKTLDNKRVALDVKSIKAICENDQYTTISLHTGMLNGREYKIIYETAQLYEHIVGAWRKAKEGK